MQLDIITPVTEPTSWVSSMLVVVKPEILRICIDPTYLNRGICREHYQMPTIEEAQKRKEVERVGRKRLFLAEKT